MKKYEIKVTGQFKKDLRYMKKRGFDLELLERIIDILAEGKTLEAKYRDHESAGDFARFRECHIQPDWLLIYCRKKDVLFLVLSRTGTHSDLF